MSGTVLIYTPQLTNRVQYTFELIFKYILKIPIDFTDDFMAFKNHEGVKLNYSDKKTNSSLSFTPHGLLHQTGFKNQETKVFSIADTKAFFKTNQNDTLNFDLFAAAFYLTTRYEEYLPHEADEHNRYIAQQSIAVKNNFIDKPVVNQWTLLLKEKIKERYPNFQFPTTDFRHIVTIDVDRAYAYKGNTNIKVAAGLLKNTAQLNLNDIKNRTQTLLNKQKDPYDVYNYLAKIQQEFKVDFQYFFLLGDNSKFDNNIPYNSTSLKNLIKDLDAEIGIHPSYFSDKKPAILKEEIKRLENITGNQVTQSRQHFIKLQFPSTYQKLLDNSITDDYSMGYHDTPGFRAGVCTPYPFYNLTKEKTTSLLIHPFAIMEKALINDKDEERRKKITMLIDKIKAVNGMFYSVWHNDSFSEEFHGNQWKQLLEFSIKY